MNTNLRLLAPLLLLALAASPAPARAGMVGMNASAGRAAVRAQVPVLLNQFFASPGPVTRAQLLTGLSLSGNDPRVNAAVRLSVAQNLAQLSVAADRAANAPGAADFENDAAQETLRSVQAYQAVVLETLQMPHVQQHLTKAQKSDVAERAAAAGVTLTPERTETLVEMARSEIEKLIAGTRSAESGETGAVAASEGVTPRASGLSPSADGSPAALAARAIPTPAALAERQERFAGVRRAAVFAGLGAATSAAALAASALGYGAAAAVVLGLAGVAAGMVLLDVVAPPASVGTLRYAGAAVVAASMAGAVAAVSNFGPAGVADLIVASVLSGFSISASRSARPITSRVFAVIAGLSVNAALVTFLPGLPPIAAVLTAIAVIALLPTLFAPKPGRPSGLFAASSARPGAHTLGSALASLAAVLTGLLGIAVAAAAGVALWRVLADPFTGFGLLGIMGAPALAVAAVVLGTALMAYAAPALQTASIRMRRR
ncbi:MAG: hypothetical protein SF051_11465 [Elusimicrobiota bacterium]|nr:hypothetical protein [Elusimicrobiota bacterium]